MRSADRKKLQGGLEEFFEGGFARGYFFCVGSVFARSLDIAQTLTGATQGVCFSFGVGDIFYDNVCALNLPWKQAKRQIKYIVKVVDAIPSSIIVELVKTSVVGKDKACKEVEKKIKKVADGALKFILVSKNSDGEFDFKNAPEISTNQFDFAEFLKTGKLASAQIELKK